MGSHPRDRASKRRHRRTQKRDIDQNNVKQQSVTFGGTLVLAVIALLFLTLYCEIRLLFGLPAVILVVFLNLPTDKYSSTNSASVHPMCTGGRRSDLHEFDIIQNARNRSTMCEAAYEFPMRDAGRHATPPASNATAIHGWLEPLTLESDETEIRGLSALLHKSVPNAAIFSICRVVNPTLEAAFRAAKSRLTSYASHWETFAWHGTRSTSPCAIYNSLIGFDPRHAQSRDRTTWFAEQASYSCSRGFVHSVSGNKLDILPQLQQVLPVVRSYDGKDLNFMMKQVLIARLLVNDADETYASYGSRIWTLMNAPERSLPVYLVTFQDDTP